MKKLLSISIILFSCIFIFSLIMILHDIGERKRDVQVFEELYKIVTEVHSEEEPNSTSKEMSELKKSAFQEVNLTTLQNINPDCAAWIYVDGTPINYPVMHTPEEINKYVHKNFYGEYSPSGTPFLQDGTSLDCDNVIIHAHNMLNGTMFAGLKKFLDVDFFNSHPTIFFQTINGISEYNIWAIAQVKDSDLWYSYINESEEADFIYLTENLSEYAIFTSTEKPNFNDRFITLSTCYGNKEEDRLILVAIEKN